MLFKEKMFFKFAWKMVSFILLVNNSSVTPIELMDAGVVSVLTFHYINASFGAWKHAFERNFWYIDLNAYWRGKLLTNVCCVLFFHQLPKSFVLIAVIECGRIVFPLPFILIKHVKQTRPSWKLLERTRGSCTKWA